MPDDWVNCVVTSPPYFWLRNYGVEDQIGQESTVDEYVENLSMGFKEVYRVLKRDGLLFLNIGDTYYSGKGQSRGIDKKSKKRRFVLRAVDASGGLGIGLQRKSLIDVPWRVGLSLIHQKMALRSTIIWHRENRLPEHVNDRPSRSYKFIFMFSKHRRYHFDKEPLVAQKVEEDMWTVPAQPKSSRLDTVPFPDKLVERCLQIGCVPGGIVLDPFMGGGTTVRVALSSEFHGVDIELNEEFCYHAVEQIERL